MSYLIPDPPQVLFVSGDALLRNRVGEALYRRGFVPLLAAHTREAVSYLSGTITPVLIVLDLDTPGLDAATLLARLRADARWSRVRVVVTGGEWRADLQIDGVLSRPLNPEQLVHLAHER